MKTILKTRLNKVFYTCLFLMISTAAFSQVNQTSDSAVSAVSVDYLGLENDMMVIGVKYINESGSRFNLSILNAEGDVLFRNHYTEKKFEQKFKVPTTHGKLNFEIAGVKTSRDFEANNRRMIVREVFVKKEK